MELLHQPITGQLGNRLIELLDSPDYQTLNIIVAFAKNSGVLRIKDALEQFKKRGGKVNVYVGVDLRGTSHEALTALLLHTDSLHVVHSETFQTFHSKIYNFVGNDKSLVIVGSHNLTSGGLWTNFESSAIIPVDSSIVNDLEVQNGVDDYIQALTSLGASFMQIETQDDIDKLLEKDYVFKEVGEKVRRTNTTAREVGRERVFGNGAPAKLPHVTTSKNVPVSLSPAQPISVPRDDDGQTIWFETRKMTGGSANIFDLSMTALVERGDPTGTPFDLQTPGFMRGGVEFFGINPTAIAEVKSITINFEGVDYTDNTILFPDGEKANGTWRLQIKGVAPSGETILDAFRTRRTWDYLKRKILTFTKIQDDYYFMSVFPDSELENFKSASRILARNGSRGNAKLLGLL